MASYYPGSNNAKYSIPLKILKDPSIFSKLIGNGFAPQNEMS